MSVTALREALRGCRVAGKQLLGLEPVVRAGVRPPLEYHGGPCGGWSIVAGSLGPGSVVLDVGLGEELSFPESLIARYGCTVHGFDPTPRAIAYARSRANPRLRVHEVGVGDAAGRVRFFLPNDASHVSGSLRAEAHLGRESIEVELVTLAGALALAGASRADLLKLDVEGTEYDLIDSAEFAALAPRIGQLCVEFHHRWRGRGKQATERAVARLRALGFECAWWCRTTNEEFTFVNVRSA